MYILLCFNKFSKLQIGCDYILQINTVGHMTHDSQSKGGALYLQGNSINKFLTLKVWTSIFKN